MALAAATIQPQKEPRILQSRKECRIERGSHAQPLHFVVLARERAGSGLDRALIMVVYSMRRSTDHRAAYRHSAQQVVLEAASDKIQVNAPLV